MKGGEDRVKSIDIAKGMGIVLVLIGHIHSQFHIDLQPVYRYFTLFHVPLFFFISGIFFNEQAPFVSFLKKKILRLFIPYLFVNSVFWVADAIYESLSFAQMDWKQLLLAVVGLEPVHNSLAGPSWFILVLFRILVLYKAIQIATGSNKWIMVVLSVVFATCGFLLSVDSFMIRQTLVALPYLCLGHVVGPVIKRNTKNGIGRIVLLAAALLLLAALSKNQNTDMAVNIYGHIPIFIAGSVLGTAAIIIISKIIEETSASLTSFWSFIGQNTMTILLWHMLFMKIIFVGCGNAIHSDLVISVVAVVLSIFLSCILSRAYSFFKQRIWSR